jgi:hypothetical protein
MKGTLSSFKLLLHRHDDRKDVFPLPSVVLPPGSPPTLAAFGAEDWAVLSENIYSFAAILLHFRLPAADCAVCPPGSGQQGDGIFRAIKALATEDNVIQMDYLWACQRAECRTEAMHAVKALSKRRKEQMETKGSKVAFSRSCVTCKRSQRPDEEKPYMFCSRCRAAYYCSKECQAKSWPTHKPECLPHNQAESRFFIGRE